MQNAAGANPNRAVSGPPAGASQTQYTDAFLSDPNADIMNLDPMVLAKEAMAAQPAGGDSAQRQSGTPASEVMRQARGPVLV